MARVPNTATTQHDRDWTVL